MAGAPWHTLKNRGTEQLSNRVMDSMRMRVCSQVRAFQRTRTS